MKMMRSTRTTSTSGVMLMSFLTPPLEPPTAPAIVLPYASGETDSRKRLLPRRAAAIAHLLPLELGRDDLEKLVRRLGHIARAGVDPSLEVVEHHDRRDGDEEAERGGD